MAYYSLYQYYFLIILLFCFHFALSIKFKCPENYKKCTPNTCCSNDGTIINIKIDAIPPERCPPIKIYQFNIGSVVCQTHCDEKKQCPIASEQIAIKVENGNGTVFEPYKNGYRRDGGHRCWVAVPPSCTTDDEYDPNKANSCGFKYTYMIAKVGKSGLQDPIVETLNAAISSLITISLKKICFSILCRTYWKISLDFKKTVDLIRKHKDELSRSDGEKFIRDSQMGNGGIEITWGMKVTSWINTAKATSYGCTTTNPCQIKNGNGDHCFDVTDASGGGIGKYVYKNLPILYQDTLQWGASTATRLYSHSMSLKMVTVIILTVLLIR